MIERVSMEKDVEVRCPSWMYVTEISCTDREKRCKPWRH